MRAKWMLLALLLFPCLTRAQSYMLAYSTDSTRSGGSALDGATNLAGSVYIFTSPAGAPGNFNPLNVKFVSYWLDNPTMSGSPVHTEFNAPYDFKNGSVQNANPWDTASVTSGIHTITQSVTMNSGATETETATFVIGALQAAPFKLPFIGSGSGSGFTVTVNGAPIPSCNNLVDGDCSLKLQIVDCNGNVPSAVVSGCPVTLSIQKTATLPTPQMVTTILATVTSP